MAAFELVTLTTAFWKSDGPRYRQTYFEDQESQAQKGTGLWEALFQMPASRISWTCAVFLLAYVGVEVALGGWIVTFMEKVRNQDNFNSGMSAAGFWLGITIGRAVLGFVTPRIGIKIAMSVSYRCDLFISADTDVSLIGLYRMCCCFGACVLAGTTIHCLSCRCFAARLFLGTNVPWCGARR